MEKAVRRGRRKDEENTLTVVWGGREGLVLVKLGMCVISGYKYDIEYLILVEVSAASSPGAFFFLSDVVTNW